MRPRVYVSEPFVTPSLIRLPDEEARHVSRVLRAAAGDEVSVFDGRGGEWIARIETIGRSGVFVRTGAATTPAPEMSTRLVVGQALLKGDSMDDVVRDAVMLGAAEIQPIVSARIDVPSAALSRGGRIERWQRVALASAKQCGRAVVPTIESVQSMDRFVTAAAGETKLLFVEPSMLEGTAVPLADASRLPAPAQATVAIGPEGGWSREEIESARAAGFLLCSLGGLTLRAERAAVVALSMLRFVWQD